MARRRILFVNKYAHVTGGADLHTFQLIDELRRRGHVVALLSTASPANVEHGGAFVPLTVTHETKRTLPHRARLGVAANAVWNATAARAARELIHRTRPQLVHAAKLYPQLSVAPVAVARRARLPIVQALYDYEFVSANPLEHRGRPIDTTSEGVGERFLNTATYALRRHFHRRCVTRWIAVSDFVRDVHRRNGVEAAVLEIPTPAAGPPPPRTGRRGVVFVGRLTREKGVEDVIEAARLAPSLEFTVFGAGPLAEAVERAAAELPNLRFGGWRDSKHVVSEFAKALVAVIPSLWQEPGPLVALEARAAGTPVVAYATGGLPDYVGAAGRVVRPSPHLLAAAATELYDDERAWQECATAAAAAAAAWQISDYVDALEQVYDEALHE